MKEQWLLPKAAFEEFKQFLDGRGIAYRPGKGPNQVLQVMTDTGFAVVFKNKHVPNHYTVQMGLEETVKDFLENAPRKKAEFHKDKFIVINRKFIEEMKQNSPDANQIALDFEIALHEFCEGYFDEFGKELSNVYYVCNQDEPYSQKVIDIILEGEAKKEQNGNL